MASTRPLDIVARFRTVTTDFNTREVEQELTDADRAFIRSQKIAGTWSTKVGKAADDAADDIRRSDIADAGTEVGDEFTENIGEAFRSGDYLGALQETFTSLAPKLGPIGLAIGAAIGVAAGVVADIQKNNEIVKAAGQTLFDALQDGFLEQAEKEALLLDLFDTDSLSEAYRGVASLAKRMGVDAKDVFKEITSGGAAATALDSQIDRLQRKRIPRPGRPIQGAEEQAAWEEYQKRLDLAKRTVEDTNSALRTQETLVRNVSAAQRGARSKAERIPQ